MIQLSSVYNNNNDVNYKFYLFVYNNMCVFLSIKYRQCTDCHGNNKLIRTFFILIFCRFKQISNYYIIPFVYTFRP